MSIPQLNQGMIREYASDKSWHRGVTYYNDGYVRRVSQRGDSITTEVLGSSPYRVT